MALVCRPSRLLQQLTCYFLLSSTHARTPPSRYSPRPTILSYSTPTLPHSCSLAPRLCVRPSCPRYRRFPDTRAPRHQLDTLAALRPRHRLGHRLPSKSRSTLYVNLQNPPSLQPITLRRLSYSIWHPDKIRLELDDSHPRRQISCASQSQAHQASKHQIPLV